MDRDRREAEIDLDGRLTALDGRALADGDDVDEQRAIDGVRPAEEVIVAVQHERRAGKEPAGHVPAFFGVDLRLVPGDRPLPGLV